MSVLSPKWSPTVSDLPIADPPPDQHRVVVTYASTRGKDSSFVVSPLPCIHMHHNWSKGQPFVQCLATVEFIPRFYFELAWGSCSFALSRFGVEDRANVGIGLFSGESVFEDMFVDVFGSLFFKAMWAAIDDFLFC